MTTQIFAGKLAIVTGGGRGIGRAVCHVLARDGACVVAADINKDAAQKTVSLLPDSSKHVGVELDVSNKASVEDTIEMITSRYQRPPSLLANVAGITRDSFLLKMDENMFMDVINVNLKGTFLMTQAVAAALLKSETSEGASFVNLSSIMAKGGNMGQSNYAASKAGVEAFTKSAAKELARDGIRVNCVVPGFINTAMVDTVPEHLKSLTLFATAMKRMGEPQELADTVAYLLSDKSSFMTGACLEVTGGLFI